MSFELLAIFQQNLMKFAVHHYGIVSLKRTEGTFIKHYKYSSSSASFPTFMWGRCFLCYIHWTRSCPYSPENSLSNKSFLMLSNLLCFGLPLLLFPGTSITITIFPTHSSSLLKTCPYHFNLLSCTFLDISPTFAAPLILSYLIMSSLVAPLNTHLNILITATSNFFSCAFLTAQLSIGTVHHCWS